MVLGELLRGEFTALDIAGVDLGVLYPLLRQIVQGKNGRHWAHGHARAAVDAFHGIDVELRNGIERGTPVVVSGILLGVYAIYGASLVKSH